MDDHKPLPPLPPLDRLQRYTIPESCRYLRKCRAAVYADIRDGKIRIIKDGRRTYVPGSEIASRSAVPE